MLDSWDFKMMYVKDVLDLLILKERYRQIKIGEM